MSDNLNRVQKDLLRAAHVRALVGSRGDSVFVVDARNSKANANKRDAIAGLRSLGLVDGSKLSAAGAPVAAALHAAWKAGK